MRGQMAETYSIRGHFDGSTALITGASGYVGSLCLEKLLRSTSVRRVYVLLRAKRAEGMQARLAKLMASPVMHLLRGSGAEDKVVAISGDMTLPGLGISPDDVRRLQREVDTVIHCAADIRLEVGIQELLTANYRGTQQLLQLAAGCDHLAAFVHVSSAYTNMNAAPGSLVKEAIYPLTYGDQPIDDAELVQELLALPAHNANLRASGLLKNWNFPNNYTLSKHLSEYMVADAVTSLGLPIAIVRPTLISSVARDPYPGFTGNFAGHVGATLAFMAGLFESPEASNYKGGNVWDVVPADVVVADILAAAAAVGARMAKDCTATATQHGRLLGSSSLPSGAWRGAAGRAAKASHGRAPLQLTAFATGAPLARAALAVAPAAHSGTTGGAEEQPLLIIHSGTSTLYPLTIMESWNWGVEVYGAWPTAHRLCSGCAAPLTAEHEPNPSRAAKLMAWTGWKVWAVSRLLSTLGHERVAKKLSVGFESFRVINQPKTDVNLRFSTANMQRLASLLDPAEREEFLLLWRPGNSGGLGSLVADRVSAAASPRGVTAIVAPACGTPKFAWTQQKASAAAAFSVDATSSAASAAAAAAAVVVAGMPPPLLAAAPSLEDGIIRAGSALPSEASCSASQLSYSCGDSDSSLVRSCGSSEAEPHSGDEGEEGSRSLSASAGKDGGRRHGAVLGPQQAAALAAMQAVPIRWREFHINLGAYLYCTTFRMPEPAQPLPVHNKQVLAWLNIKPADAVITHQFKLYK